MPAKANQHPPPRTHESPPWLVTTLSLVEDLVYIVVALALIGIAVAALYNTVSDLISSSATFSVAVTNAVNGVLFVVIVLEIFRTLVAHLEGGGFQLMPFLIIGVISAVRHILLVGALSISNESFNHTQIELGVNAGVALILVLALVLVHRSGMASDIVEDDEAEA